MPGTSRARVLTDALIAALFVFLPSLACATSCQAMEERYYFTCDSGACIPDFRAVPINNIGGMCARRDLVSDMPEPIANYLARLIVASQDAPPTGVYSLHFNFWWFQYKPSNSFEQFQENLLREYIRDRDGRDLDFISINEVADKLNLGTDRSWIRREAPGITAAQLKQNVINESQRQYVRGIRIIAGCAASVGVAFALLLYSLWLFRKAVAEPTGSSLRWRWIAVAMQVLLVLTPVLTSVYLWMFTCPWLLLTWPGVVTIWIIEGVWAVRYRKSRRSAIDTRI